jgi:hypothetical protein
MGSSLARTTHRMALLDERDWGSHHGLTFGLWLERAQCELRELQNVIERSVIVCDSDQFSIDESWLSPRSSESGSKRQFQFSQKLAAHEKEMIESVLRETKGRIFGPSGAENAGTTLDSKIWRLGTDKNRSKSPSPKQLPIDLVTSFRSVRKSSVVNVLEQTCNGDHLLVASPNGKSHKMKKVT